MPESGREPVYLLVKLPWARGLQGRHSEADMLDVSKEDSVETVTAVVAQIAEQHDIRRTIARTDSLVDRGMTSMAMVDLMLAIEAAFDVTIPQRELTPANFQSIDSLAHLVARL